MAQDLTAGSGQRAFVDLSTKPKAFANGQDPDWLADFCASIHLGAQARLTRAWRLGPDQWACDRPVQAEPP